MKTYVVYFFIKANRTEYLADVAVGKSCLRALQGLVFQDDRQERFPAHNEAERRRPEVV